MICSPHCIITAIVAPLLLAMQWLVSNDVWVPGKRSGIQVVADTNDGVPTDPHPSTSRPCEEPHTSSRLPYCDTTLSKEERVTDLISHLTTKEKISLLGHDSPSIDRPGMHLPAYKWWNEGLHGMAWTDCCPPYEWKNVTVFPQVIGLATAWNRTLWSEVGGVIGAEAMQKVHSSAAKSDGPHPGLTYFTPNINIFRDPRWGRGQETPGEDPYLTSHYAAVMVMSLQYGKEFLEQFNQHSKDAVHAWKPRVAATCKHFAAYSLETGRYNFSSEIHDPRDWDDTYLPAFDACIHAGDFLHEYYGTSNGGTPASGAMGVMCSYNSINQVPACANPAFLRDKLRREWNYSHYVVSDCWAIHNIHEHHRYASSYPEAAGMALRAGVDLDCGDTIQGYGMQALEEGFVDIDDVDRALMNLFGVLMDLSYFDNQAMPNAEQLGANGESQRQYHNQVALEAALQSTVLLKNGHSDGSSDPIPSPPLPLSIVHRKVTLIGPLADDKELLLGNYHGVPSRVITPRQGLQDFGIEVEYIQGCNVTGASDEESKRVPNESLCERVSADSEATILIMGLNQDIEAEGIDRTSLLLPKLQRDAIEDASRCSKAKRAGAPVILVVIAGSPVDLSSYKNNDSIDAILFSGYPGQAAGDALTQLLYGKYNPSGRLVTTMYYNSLLDHVALGDMRMRPDKSSTLEYSSGDLYPGRTHRFYTGSAVYPFGYGLSYTSWAYSIELTTVIKANFKEGGEISVSRAVVKVSNNGSMDGSNSVLLFHMGPNAGRRGNPIKSLIGFEKVFVVAGSAQVVEFNIQKWMTSQEAGSHTFMVGPSMIYALEVNTLGSGMQL